MDPQNQNPNQSPNYQPNPQVPQQPANGYGYGQPAQPQGPYVQPPYSPMPAGNNGQPVDQQAEKNNKKLIVVIIILGVLFLGVVVLAVFMNLQGPKGNSMIQKDLKQAYDSPVGFAPGLQSEPIKSGKFKLRASYVTGGDFERVGEFSVVDGQVRFDMVPDDGSINNVIRQLYEKRKSSQAFDVKKHGVDKVQTFDFASMLGYNFLFDENGGRFSGFVPAVEAAKSASSPDKKFTLTTTCDRSLAEMRQKLNMNTLGMEFEFQEEGVHKTIANITFSTLRDIDAAVAGFFENCYDLNAKSNAKLRQFVEDWKKDVTVSPRFTFWQDDGTQYIEVSSPPKDTPFGGSMHFELSELSKTEKELEGEVGSYVERRNQYGLAYSMCRVDPVITRSTDYGYRFIREDPAYEYPTAADTGYYCTTLSVPSQYSSAESMDLRSKVGAQVKVTGETILGLRGHHDLVYEIERYNIANKRYPGPTEFRDMASSNMDSLTSITQAAFNDETLVYKPLPEGCVGTCNDYSLSFAAGQNVQMQRSMYQP